MDFFCVRVETQGRHFLVRSCRTHNSLDGEVVDLLAGVGPEELPVLPADLLATTRQKQRRESQWFVSSVCGGEAGGQIMRCTSSTAAVRDVGLVTNDEHLPRDTQKTPSRLECIKIKIMENHIKADVAVKFMTGQVNDVAVMSCYDRRPAAPDLNCTNGSRKQVHDSINMMRKLIRGQR